MKNKETTFYIIFSFLNLLILSTYLIFFDLPKGSILFYLIAILAFTSILSILLIKIRNFFFKILTIVQLPIFSIILIFSFLEVLYIINPHIFPSDLRIWINKEGKNTKVIEYLDSSPYVKFKPNNEIRIRFYRGRVDQFEYSWITDQKGFKNSPSLSSLSQVDIVAIGDSNTEGFGVSIENTFPSILTSKGYPTYNLGVQGYSPSQMLGSLKEFGITLKPKYVVAAYTMVSYRREKLFLKKENTRYPGGIGNIESAEINPEIRNQAKFLFSGLWLMKKNLRNNIKNKIKYPSVKFVEKQFNSYKRISEVSNYNTTPVDDLSWKVTLDSFSEIKKISDKIGAKLLLVYIPNRAMIYYERATQKKIPKSAFNESNLLEEFALQKDIFYINPFSKLNEYVNNLPKNFKLKSLPFLEIDGHMNRIGYEIISEEIIKKLK